MINLLIAILLSISPISELRVGIPFAFARNLGAAGVLACIIANIFVFFIALFILDFLNSFLLKFKPYKAFFNFTLRRMRKKAEKLKKQMNQYGYLALFVFVAVPLPITGAWTGTLIAWILGLNRTKSFAAIASGVIIAGAIVTLASLGIIRLFF